MSAPTRALIASGDNDVLVSAIGVAEMAIKSALGKLTHPDGLADRLAADQMAVLDFGLAHAEALRTLPMHHRDLFDRMMIVQAQVDRLTFVTADARCAAYDIAVLQT
jgi:PIN domain nuclease of toxin-antitoxin system